MKRLFSVLKWVITVILLAVVALYITGNAHLFRGVSLTYLKGLTGPTIEHLNQ